MTDIAEHLGVSRLTVSAVLNNRHGAVGISPDTAERVRAAALKLGYVRNQMALATKTGHTRVIGGMVSAVGAEWAGRALSGVLASLRASGYLLNLEEIFGAEAEHAALTRFMEQRVAGMFCCNLNPSAEFIAEIRTMSQRYKCPVVTIDSRAEINGYRLGSDDIQGCRHAVEHLWELGHRRIAFLNLHEKTTAACLRREGFLQAMSALGGRVPDRYLIESTGNAEMTEQRIMALFGAGAGGRRASKRPTALFCFSDLLAAVSLRALRRIGLLAPRDYSVVGFAALPLGEYTDPQLTSVVQPFYEMGKRCGVVLLERIAKRERRTALMEGNELLPTSLIVRESTAQAPVE